MIKESCNLIGQEAQLTTPNQKWLSRILPPLNDKLHAKKQTDKKQKNKDHLIPSRDINDERILLSDWMRGTTGKPTKRGSPK